LALDVYRDWLGIKTPERPPDYYTLLGLKRFEDDRAVIQRRYRERVRLVRRYAAGKYANESQDLLDELARAMLTLTDPARKAEYDRKLGRKTKQPDVERRSFEQILVEDGYVRPAQLEDAKQLAEQLGIDLRDALVQKGYLNWEEATRALAQHYNMPYLDPSTFEVRPEVAAKVPQITAKRERIVPLLLQEEGLFVAVQDALNVEPLERLRFQFGVPVRAVLCSPPAIDKLIETCYATEAGAGQSGENPPAADTGGSFATKVASNMKMYAIGSALAGIAIGYLVAGLPGACVGAGLGALAVVLVVRYMA